MLTQFAGQSDMNFEGRLGRRERQTGGVVAALLLVLSGIAVVGLLTWFFYCPCERIPGGYLMGAEAVDAFLAEPSAVCGAAVCGGIAIAIGG